MLGSWDLMLLEDKKHISETKPENTFALIRERYIYLYPSSLFFLFLSLQTG